MADPLKFDPTRKNGGVDMPPKRPMGQIVIQYDHNTGGLAFQTQGLLPIEGMGVAQWFLGMRMKAFLAAEDNKQVILAPPGSQVTKPNA